MLELKELYRILRNNGKIIFVVPCESISYKYVPNDINHHLYSWSPMAIGNLFAEAGFEVIESVAYIHQWPNLYEKVAPQGRNVFEIACRKRGLQIWKRFTKDENSWLQVRVVAQKI